MPQFFGGVRTESDEVEHYDRLERRTRQSYRLGTWVRPGVRRLGAAPDREGRPRRRTGSSTTCDVLLTPTIGAPAAGGRHPRRASARSARRCGRLPAIAYAALWNVAGNPAASVPCGLAADGLPTAVQLVGRTDDEATLLRLSAQIEAARPWPLQVAVSTDLRDLERGASGPWSRWTWTPPRSCTPPTSSW